MIKDFLDQDVVSGYVAAVRKKLESGELDERAAPAAFTIGRGSSHPAAAILAAFPETGAGPPSSGQSRHDVPFLSRDPAVSMLQTTLEDEARKSGFVETPKHGGRFSHIVGAIEAIEHEVASILHPVKFASNDPDWVTKIAEATLDRIAQGNHPFNPQPAEFEIPQDDARVVIVGDWGSGLPRALDVARWMAEEVADALAHGRAVHVIHLGDVYYSGDIVEYQRRMLADGAWPVTVDQARAGVTSWTLNGNHDMYAGGYGYFETCLGDERFAGQRSADGKGTSFFRIKTPSWDLVGLDTSWNPEVLSKGLVGVLEDPQAEQVIKWAAESERKLMILSHHQLISAYDVGDLGTVLPYKLQPLLDGKRIAAWLWGHEHRCMGFADAEQRIPFVRCIGHGGVPIPVETGAIPKPGIWLETESYADQGENWHRFGFAVIDFDGRGGQIRYRDDEGTQTRVEQIA
ncbi:MAG TPA: metallophosphoesterase [Solirubrobacteraceae bacterium]|nr:metallophosphoesterase [Solirubrobacteraceae bacterium]